MIKSLIDFVHFDNLRRVEFKLTCGPGCQTKIVEFMTTNRISLVRMTLMFSFYYNFNINALVNIW